MPIGHNHYLHFHYSLNRELTELYVSVALRNFALGLITIFEPIYVFLFFKDILGLPHALSLALIYFAIQAIGHGLMYPVGSKILSMIGVKRAILLSIPILFLYYIGLWQIGFFGLFIFLLPLVGAVAGGIYWPAFHLDFLRFSKRESRGKQISYRSVVGSFAAAASPFLGGFLIVQFGFPFLFGAVLVMLLLSVLPLFLSPEIYDVNHISIKEAVRDVFSKSYRWQMLGFASMSVESVVAAYIWPIFLFTILISFETLGIIMSATMFLTLVFVLYLGRLIDRKGAEGVLKIGVLLNMITWPIRIFVHTPLDVFLAQTLHGLMRRTAYLPLGVLVYNWMGQEPHERMSKIIARGMVLNVTTGLGLLLFALLFLFTDTITISFAIAAGISPFVLLFLRKLNPSQDKGS